MMRPKDLLIMALCGTVVAAVSASGYLPTLAGLPVFTPDEALLSHWRLLMAGVAGWVLFGIYWEIAARIAISAARPESGASRGYSVFLANVAFLLGILPISGLGRMWPASTLIMVAGLTVEALGLVLAVWARRHQDRNWSGENSIHVDHQWIRSGPYRLLRHPNYTGLLIMYVGLALVSGEQLAIVGLAVAVIAYRRKIRLEEDDLLYAFGGEYDAYRRETWALVPGLF